jgi:adenine/guanine phosphoribosyltransferase-like PRPP-binding protein
MVVAGPDAEVCRVCGGVAPAGFAHCFCCATLVRQLRMGLVPVVAVAEYRVGDRLHRRLRGYKDAPVAEARETCATFLADLVGRWMAADPDRLCRRFDSGWDLVATVPSSGRPVGAPADALVRRVPPLAAGHRTLLVRGPEPTGHLRAARLGFELSPSVDRESFRSRRVLVFDDSIATGARAQSAAAALRRAGAEVIGVLAVGRVVAGHRSAAGRGLD